MKKTIFTFVLSVTIMSANIGIAGEGFIWRTGKSGSGNARNVHARLTRQYNTLANRIEREIPAAAESLRRNFHTAHDQLRRAQREDSRLILQNELYANAHYQVALEVLKRDCREALLRVDSMLRQLEIDRDMPDGMLLHYEQSSSLVAYLVEGELAGQAEAVRVDPSVVKEKLESLMRESETARDDFVMEMRRETRHSPQYRQPMRSDRGRSSHRGDWDSGIRDFFGALAGEMADEIDGFTNSMLRGSRSY